MNFNLFNPKRKDFDQAVRYADRSRERRQVVVLVTGVFDLIHQEHKNFLNKAKQAGDILLVGLETDRRVTAIKGPGRPVNSQIQRLLNLEKLKIADLVFLLPEEFSKPADHETLISRIMPDILAVSSHTQHLAAKSSILQKYGGRVLVVHQHNPRISSTILINREKLKK
jgi:rfaE bifunctional protein nucleotidyltransferase chain/domain